MKQRIKVVWVCHLSNPEVREHLPVQVPLAERLVRKVMHNPSKENSDFAVWNTNGIQEMENMSDRIDLYVIAPYHYLIPDEVRFEIRGVHYFFFKDTPSFLTLEARKRLLGKYDYSYERNRAYIKKEIEAIKPDIVHVIGIENPYYSLAALDIPDEIPYIVQLQTLLSVPNFKENYFMRGGDYDFRQRVEQEILVKAHHIGSPAVAFHEVIRKINPSATIHKTALAVTEPIKGRNAETVFDFVYFASSINKAADLAVEAFAIAHQSHPEITLDIVGGGSPEFVADLSDRIQELGLTDSITIEGRLATHDDVINQIRKSRFALLPLKVDLISGTIREAMANGLPVLTTITPSTPSLNKNRECVLLSESGDHEALASNMCRLLENNCLADNLSENCLMTASERKTNKTYMQEWLAAYQSIIDERQ